MYSFKTHLNLQEESSGRRKSRGASTDTEPGSTQTPKSVKKKKV